MPRDGPDMNFDLTEEHQMLQDMVARYLGEHHDFDAKRAIARADGGFSRQLWERLADQLGILGASFPESAGGTGGSALDTIVIARELGRALVSSPYIPTIVTAGGLLARSGAAGLDMLRSIIAGQAVVAYCDGIGGAITVRKSGEDFVLDGKADLVIGGGWADWLLVSARDARGAVELFLLPSQAPGIDRRDHVTIDGGSASDFRFSTAIVADGGPILTGGTALDAIAAAEEEGEVALCAEACGILRKMLEDTLEYARQREQFGRAISAFQVIQHRLVDMFMAVEQADAATMLAGWSLDSPDRGKAVAAAKVQVAQACRGVGQAAIQIHGGIGMTDELPLGHYFRRATMIERLFGAVDDNLRRYAELNRPVVQTEDAA